MAKKQLVFIAFGCLSAGTKFTVDGKAFIKIKKDIVYNPDENSALQVSTGEIYSFNYTTPVFCRMWGLKSSLLCTTCPSELFALQYLS